MASANFYFCFSSKCTCLTLSFLRLGSLVDSSLHSSRRQEQCPAQKINSSDISWLAWVSQHLKLEARNPVPVLLSNHTSCRSLLIQGAVQWESQPSPPHWAQRTGQPSLDRFADSLSFQPCLQRTAAGVLTKSLFNTQQRSEHALCTNTILISALTSCVTFSK